MIAELAVETGISPVDLAEVDGDMIATILDVLRVRNEQRRRAR
jgi:hypothetical protein